MTPETAVKQQVKDYLRVKGVFNFHLMAGMAAYPGAPDRIAVKDGRCYAIECKAPRGKLSPHQEAFRGQWEDSGGIYIEARSIEDLISAGL